MSTRLSTPLVLTTAVVFIGATAGAAAADPPSLNANECAATLGAAGLGPARSTTATTGSDWSPTATTATCPGSRSARRARPTARPPAARAVAPRPRGTRSAARHPRDARRPSAPCVSVPA